MRADVLSRLRCPVCADPLDAADRSVRCPRGHSFDLARQGYVNLLTGQTRHRGDSAEMVAAREEFLLAGHYDPITGLVAGAAARELAGDGGAAYPEPAGAAGAAYPDLVVDAGAGTGRYLGAVLDAAPAAVGLALDVSKPALRRAARAHPRASAALADTWRGLPVADRAARLVLNVFAPRNGPEFHRVLRPDGTLLVLTPAADHLGALVDRLRLLRVDPDKADRTADRLADRFDLVRRDPHRYDLDLPREAVGALVGMGPSAWHTDPEALAAGLRRLPDRVPVTVSVELASYRPR
ncbi:putative RNA methyltransferase [Plantactinospora sp. KBS50]|uniref:putative RNA methyltransferase n=1 Tax=Plantactinospora sp. KBS50 TaxID=2024580 RepID=UPI000BAAA02B|nr:23S rRNA methyltransferase [Plantactinospora sp. KBS50]ASW56735.1 23S rRNA methyltransferase [Plantactinospora sp. KBS50]